MEIIALKQYTDKYISLYEGEIRNVADWLATKLITDGVVQQHSGEVLPSVSSTDNGKVLTVVEGSWAKENPESNEFIVTTINTGSDFSAPSPGYNDIIEALNAGKNVVLEVGSLSMDSDGPARRAYLHEFYREVDASTHMTDGDIVDTQPLEFRNFATTSTKLIMNTYTINTNNEISVSKAQVALST